MTYSKIPVAQSIVSLCLSKGIDRVIISPGSRNAPLIITFSNHPNIKAYSIVDERSAAFVALGMAQCLKKPVAVICTSGSALLNYYPAVAEAFYSDIPLVVISADRPIERIDIGDGQTIRQKNVFENHILYSANLYSEAVPINEPLDEKIKQKLWESQRHNEQEINKALNVSIEKKGPVHINVPFYEPLYDTVETINVKPLEVLPEIQERKPLASELESYSIIWNNAKRKLVLVGVQEPQVLSQEIIEQLATDESVIFMTETTSNIHHSNIFCNIDTLIAPIERQDDADHYFKKLQPEVLLTFGGMVVSKKIKAFLRAYQPKHHWHVDSKKAYNTYFCLEKHFEYRPADFFDLFTKQISPVSSTYFNYWNSIKQKQLKAQKAFEDTIEFSDFLAFKSVFHRLPQKSILQLSNSATVRYAQLFKIHPSIEVYCNRGTSGIDGSTSTAVGHSITSSKPTTFVTGDLSFFYDSNAFWNNHIPSSFRVILINNSGGGIFRILPGHKDNATFDQFFETTHSLTAQHLCNMHSIEYKAVNELKTLENTLEGFFNDSQKPKLLEIFTPRQKNDDILKAYFKALKT